MALTNPDEKDFFPLPLDIVRIVSFPNEPFTMDCFDKYPEYCTDPGPGVDVQFLYTAVRHIFQKPVHWIRASSDVEMLKFISNGSADVAGTVWRLNLDAITKYHHTVAFQHDVCALLFPRRLKDFSSNFHSTSFIPFSIWMYAFCSFVLVYTTCHLSHFCYRYFPFFSNNLLFVKIVRLIRERVNYCFLFLVLYLFFSLFSNIISVALVAKHTQYSGDFESMTSLGQKLLTKTCSLVIMKHYTKLSTFYTSLINPAVVSELPWTKLLSDAYRANPPIVVNTVEEMVHLVQDVSHCFVGVEFETSELFYKELFPQIDFVSLAGLIQQEKLAFLTASAGIAEGLNEALTSIEFAQLYRNIMENYYQRSVDTDESVDSEDIATVTVAKLQDGFYLLLVGWTLASILLLIEKKFPTKYYFSLLPTRNLSTKKYAEAPEECPTPLPSTLTPVDN